MKKWSAVFLGLALGAALWFYFFRRPIGTPLTWPQTQSTEQQNAAVSRALANQPSNTVAIIHSNFARVQAEGNGRSAVEIPTQPAGPAAPLEVTNMPPDIAVQNVSRMIHQYGEMFGGNPVGTNPEITSQLEGKNPKHIDFISAEAGMRVNGDGELIDPWGTPYFFHQLSGSDTEIRSAGPDKIMYTADDIVVH